MLKTITRMRFLKLNVTQPTINALQEMVDESFIMTARCDRYQSVLDAKFAYNNTALLVHHGFAHVYSGFFGDAVADLGLQGYDITVNYGNVPPMNQQYNSVKEILYELKDYVFDYQNKLNMCWKVAFDNMDIHVAADVFDIIEDHNELVRQVILLCNKIEIYNGSASYDAHVLQHFNLLGVSNNNSDD